MNEVFNGKIEVAIPVEVGASERLQPVTEAPASVSFITAEEIARHGYRTLADILRAYFWASQVGAFNLTEISADNLLINLVVVTHLLYSAFCGRHYSKRIVLPLVLLSIPMAIGIHTVTAFLYNGLAARPYWNASILAPQFLASAFSSGPAILLIVEEALDAGGDPLHRALTRPACRRRTARGR